MLGNHFYAKCTQRARALLLEIVLANTWDLRENISRDFLLPDPADVFKNYSEQLELRSL